MNIEKALEYRSCWITPNGELVKVTHERHDFELPKPYRKIETAEKACVRVSCAWGYDAPISHINIPKRLTVEQAKILIDFNEAVGIIKHLEFLFSTLGSWDEIKALID